MEETKVDGAAESRKLDTSQFLGRCSCSSCPSCFCLHLCMFTHLVVNSGPDVEGLVRALLYNFWLHYEEAVIVLMKEMEGMTEERDDIVYDENQQCGILPIQISESIFPLWLFSLL